MFTTCFFCSADLGRNEVLETMPVGRRLAFSERTGRLWIVCRRCERWNLSPLEERWEAIEAAERLFRDARLRVSTDNVGLARLREGLDLVRIGEPQRPEFAAWRYGDQFGRRRKRQLASTGAIVGAVGAVIIGGAWAGASIASFAGFYANGGMWDRIIHGKPTEVVARVKLASGETVNVQRQHARMSALWRPEATPGAPFAIRLEHEKGVAILAGAEAARAAQQLLPTVNRFGGSKKMVDLAVRSVEEAGGPEQALAALTSRHGATPHSEAPKRIGRKNVAMEIKKYRGGLHALAPVDRLALEMALHEESERRAMDGELAALEAAWREAEQIAGIADGMFQPPAVTARLESLREAAGAAPPDSTDRSA